MQKYLLPGAAVMSLVSGGASAAAVPIGTFTETASASCPAPTGSIWPSDPPLRDGDVGGIFNNSEETSCGPISFEILAGGTLVISAQPAVPLFAGDVYQVFVDGNSVGVTTPVPLFGSNFSAGTFTMPISAGTHNFNINDQLLSYIGFQAPYGPPATTVPAGFSPNSVAVTLTELPAAVPEPRSLWEVAVGLAGLGYLWKRRSKT